MTRVVTLSPSGRTIEVQPGETILEAALRNGVAVSYHCDNGSCGSCRARILDGALADTLPHDYVFSEADRQHPMLLMCRARPATDMVIEAAEAHSPRDIPPQQIHTCVTKIEPIGSDVRILHLRTPRSKTLRFLAGQYVRLSIGAARYHKSIASCPCNGRDLQFHFRRNDDPFIEHVFEGLKLRDAVVLDGPFGNFTLDEDSGRAVVFVAGALGFAPVKSLIEHLIALEWSRPVRLYWLDSGDGHHYLENYCRSWRDALEDFDYRLAPANDFDGLKAFVGGLGEADFYVSVPEQSRAPVSGVLGNLAVVPGRMRLDDFSRLYPALAPA
jgi:CDP-4-dehydro-6-deoxyglucose reductase